MSGTTTGKLVADDGVATATEMQAHYDAALQKRCETLGAPKGTIDAVMYSAREYGIAALAGRNFQNRLAELSPHQVREIIVRLDPLRPKYPAITDNLLLLLAELINAETG